MYVLIFTTHLNSGVWCQTGKTGNRAETGDKFVRRSVGSITVQWRSQDFFSGVMVAVGRVSASVFVTHEGQIGFGRFQYCLRYLSLASMHSNENLRRKVQRSLCTCNSKLQFNVLNAFQEETHNYIYILHLTQKAAPSL